MRPRVAVIGGGISGLAAAHALARQVPSIDFVVLEATERLGGVLKTTQRDGFLVEHAADNFLTTPSAAVDLCREVGLENSLLGTDPDRRGVFVVSRGRLQPVPAGFFIMAPGQARPILTTKLLSFRGKARVGLEYFVPRKTGDDDESLAAFVRRRFGREMLDHLVQPLVGGIYAADLERLSLQATLPHFARMERDHGSLIQAMIRKRRDQAGDACHGARYGMFAAPRDGLSSLVRAIADRLPPRTVRLDSPLHRILPGQYKRWMLWIGGRRSRCLEADGVILASPAHHAAQILADLDRVLADQLSQIEYASCAVVSLGYRREQIQHPLNGFGFVVPLIEQRTIFSCSFASIKYEARAPKNAALLRVFIGGACQPGLLRLSDTELTELAEREVAAFLEIRGEPILRQLRRHHRAMPQYHVGHLDRLAAINSRLARFPGLALAGSAYGGIGIPACVRSGQAAATAVLSQLNATMSISKAGTPEKALT
jgi:oxygen-dependent protoporphyrinogen oxidase